MTRKTGRNTGEPRAALRDTRAWMYYEVRVDAGVPSKTAGELPVVRGTAGSQSDRKARTTVSCYGSTALAQPTQTPHPTPDHKPAPACIYRTISCQVPVNIRLQKPSQQRSGTSTIHLRTETTHSVSHQASSQGSRHTRTKHPDRRQDTEIERARGAAASGSNTRVASSNRISTS